MASNGFRDYAGPLANSYKPDRRTATAIAALQERADALERANAVLAAAVTRLEAENAALSALAAKVDYIEQWALTLTNSGNTGKTFQELGAAAPA
jgi:cell division protein FtsB